MGDWKIIVPEERTNLFADASFYNAAPATYWTKSGDGVYNWVAASVSQRRMFGRYSCQGSYTTGTYTYLVQNVVTSATTYTLSVYATSATKELTASDFWCRFNGTKTAWASMTKVAIDPTTGYGWYRCVYTGTASGGSVQMGFHSTVGTSYSINIDGAQLELGSTASTFIDPDQPGCSANGTKFVATTTRSKNYRGGGVIKDLKDDFGFRVESAQGLGMLKPDISIDEFVSIAGGQVNQFTSGVRVATLVGKFVSDNIHDSRNDLIAATKYNLLPKNENGWQPVAFIYTGSYPWKVFQGHIISGLEGNWDLEATNLKTVEKTAIQILMPYPFLSDMSNVSVDLGEYDSTAVEVLGFAFRDMDGYWYNPNTSATYAGGINDILVASDGQVYICGNFTNYNANPDADYIVRYNPFTTTAYAMGADAFNGQIYTLAEDTKGYIYAGGTFSQYGADTNFHNVARYNPTTDTWDSMNGGVDNYVTSIVAAPKGGVWIAGNFVNHYGGTPQYNYVVHFKEYTWTQLENGATTRGVNAMVNCLTVGLDGHLFLAGDFTTAGNAATTVNYVAGYNPDTNAFYALGTGLSATSPSGEKCFALPDGRVWFDLAGTGTKTVGGVTCNTRLMIWNGNGWENALASGDVTMNDMVYGPDGVLYFAGYPSSINGWAPIMPACQIKGNVWRNHDIWCDCNGSVYASTAMAIGRIDPGNPRRYEVWTGWAMGTSIGSPMNMAYSHENSVRYDGNEPGYPIIRLTGHATANRRLISLRNGTTGYQIDFEYTITLSEQVEINFDPRNFYIRSSIYGDIPEAIIPASDIPEFYLMPGDNAIQFFVMDGVLTESAIFIPPQYDGVD